MINTKIFKNNKINLIKKMIYYKNKSIPNNKRIK